MNAVQAGAQVICLTKVPSPFQAHVWENALRAEGIQSQVVGDFLDLGDVADKQAEIWIVRQDWIRARRVLRQCCQSEVASS